MQRLEPIPVVFYQENDNGNEPVKKWLYTLSKEDMRRIGNDLRTIQLGWPLGMPLARNLGDGLWEMRTNLLNGIARVIFIFFEGEIVLLHGFIKKTQKTPSDELALARKRAKKYKQN